MRARLVPCYFRFLCHIPIVNVGCPITSKSFDFLPPFFPRQEVDLSKYLFGLGMWFFPKLVVRDLGNDRGASCVVVVQ
jgi:hypothetical protein